MGKLTRFLKNRFIEHVELRADASRALRATIAFAVPLAVCHWLNRPAEAVFISMAALNLSLPDLRGAYGVRLGILATMTLIATSSAFLGVVCAGHTFGAVAAMGLVAVAGGFWRHLSADYGPSMGVSSALLFLLGLSQPGGPAAGWRLAELTALGGVFATLLHACSWLWRPQHALRYAVAETWVAASDLTASMRLAAGPGQNPDSVTRMEHDLRAALDRTFVILGEAENRASASLLAHLEEMRREVVHFTMRIMALNTSLDSIAARPDFARCLPVMDSVLKALSDAARSVAVTLIMHRAENFAATNVRLRRCEHLIKTLDDQIAALPAGAQVRAALAQVGWVLPRIQSVLLDSTDHTPARNRLAANLPDISARSLQSLAAWMHPAARPDPVLVRHCARMAVFTMFAVALYKGFDLPRGYWIAFTIMVVLQPDYGSTRQRAAARIGGTIAGILLAGVLLWVRMPLAAVDALASVMAFLFAYFLRRNYGVAIFFVTINVVLVMETMQALSSELMIARVLCTLLGGGLALVAARIFWPVWEGEKFPSLLAAALRANRMFLLSMFAESGPPAVPAHGLLMAKRRAENANRYTAASVERLLGEPAGLQENPERAAALATYNQRITRALTVMAVHLPEAGKPRDPAIAAVVEQISCVLEKMGEVVEQASAVPGGVELTALLEKLERDLAANDPKFMEPPANLIWIQLAKMTAEIQAMTLALNMAPAPKVAAANPAPIPIPAQ